MVEEAILTGDDSGYMDIFQDAYAAIQTHVRTGDGYIVSIVLWCANS